MSERAAAEGVLALRTLKPRAHALKQHKHRRGLLPQRAWSGLASSSTTPRLRVREGVRGSGRQQGKEQPGEQAMHGHTYVRTGPCTTSRLYFGPQC